MADELSADGLALTMLPPTVPAHDVAMDGAIVYSCAADAAPVEWLRRRGVPIVAVDMTWADAGVRVTIDDRGGARRAAAHLVEWGHRQAAVLTPQPGGERLAGWLEGLAGINPWSASSTSSATNRTAISTYSRRRPTAVLCASDLVAAQVLAVAGEPGLKSGGAVGGGLR